GRIPAAATKLSRLSLEARRPGKVRSSRFSRSVGGLMRTNAEGVARELWAELDSVVPPYPAGIVAVPQPIEGTAFFPGGLGLWMEGRGVSSEFPAGQIMVVGQDFNTVATYNRARLLQSEVGTSRTWQNL